MTISELRALAKKCREAYAELPRAERQPRNLAPWYHITNADGDRAEMWIYGAIGDDWDPDDVTAGSFTRELRAITAPVIDLHINSPGGLVFDGVTIHAALKEHPSTVNVSIDGLAASAASFVAMAGDSVTIGKHARMMIHDASGMTIGNAADHQEMADLLNSLSDTIAAIYAERAGGDVEQWRNRMRAETWYTAEQAVADGLADRIGGGEEDTTTNKTTAPVEKPRSKVQAKAAWNNLGGGKGMNIEEILAAMKAISDIEDRALTNDEVKRYEALESDLANKRTEAIKNRQSNYEAPAPDNVQVQAAVHVAPKKKDDGLDRAFNHYLRTGKPNADISELRISNAQSVGTDSQGGFTAPEGFRQKLVERLKAFGGLANEAETIDTDTGNRLPWPTLDDTGNSGVIAGEGAAPASGGADLVFGERDLTAWRYTAPGAGQLPLRVSVELLQDSAFDIEAMVIRKLGERIARAQAVHWVTGTGVGMPEGIIQSTGPSKVFAGADPTKNELIDAVHSLDPEYRMNAVWVFNDASLAKIRKLEDTTGRPLWLPLESAGLENTPGGTLLGHRVVIDQAFANYVDVSGGTWGVFGDIAESYVIRRVRDIQVVVNPWTRANEGQVEYTLWSRADGAIQNPNSVSLLKNDAV